MGTLYECVLFNFKTNIINNTSNSQSKLIQIVVYHDQYDYLFRR